MADDDKPSTDDVNTTVASLRTSPPADSTSARWGAAVEATQPGSAPSGAAAFDYTGNPLGEWGDISPKEAPKMVEEANTGIADQQQKRALTSLDLNNLGRPQQQIRLPEQGSYPMTPESTARHALSAFSNPLMWLAIAGGALTRNHALGALTAATGVLEGTRANEMELQKLHAQKFKGSVAGAKLEAQRQIAAYEPILNDPNMSSADKIAVLTGHAAALQDNIMLNCLRAGNLGHCQEMVGGLKKMVGGLSNAEDRHAGRMKEIEAQHEARMKEIGARQQGAGAVAPGAPEEGSKLSPKAQAAGVEQATVDAIGQYRQQPYTGSSRNPKQLATMDEVNRQYKGYNAQNWYGGKAATTTTMTAGPRAEASSLKGLTENLNAAESYERLAISNAQKLLQLAQKVDPSGVPAINRYVLAGRQAIGGDEDVAALHTQWTVTIPEFARLLNSPRLTGQLTDTARHEVEGAIPLGSTVGQFKSILGTLEGDARRRVLSTEAQISKVRKQLGQSFPEPTDEDRALVKQYASRPEVLMAFIKKFGVEP